MEMRKYNCGYCGYVFHQVVDSIMTDTPVGFTPKVKASSQVKCPYCHAFLKTWDEGEKIQDIKKWVGNRVVELNKVMKV